MTLTDLLPPRIRYGYVHPLTARVLQHPLPEVTAVVTQSDRPRREAASGPSDALVVALVADHLDVGGIGAVIEMLADALPRQGVRPVVVCHGDGVRARRMRERGIEVRSAHGGGTAELFADVEVIELHSAPRYLETLAVASDLPLVTAMHNTEIHFTRTRWRQIDALMRRSSAGIAVSDTVREFHARHLPPDLRSRLVVVPNGAPAVATIDAHERGAARRALAERLAVDLDGDFVIVCLARYDSQKNVAGTVASLLHAFERPGLDHVRFVYAGTPSDWAELRRADAIRRASPHADRVHLLGNSDPYTLLSAADAFLLNSFFEGWPVAATEAAAAGLPLVLSDVGGARELVSADPSRATLLPNAAGDAAEVSDARVRAARRHARRQRNRDDLADAVRRLAEEAAPGPRLRPAETAVSVDAMAAGHARVLSAAVPRRRGDSR